MSRFDDGVAVLGSGLQDTLHQSRLLVVGAGGIGCELLKNLVLSGFHHIELIDLDTIDLSNLNRQFLFRKQHIDCSKAEVARDSALKFNGQCQITAHHANIKEARFGIEYFSQFSLVLMALDNVDARRHVNRMCLAADVPLVESGTAGYLGQVQVIKKKRFECYECRPAPRTKSYAYCTIHNTPSKPIHCIVWAKIKFSDHFSAQGEQEIQGDEEEADALKSVAEDPVLVKEEEALAELAKTDPARHLFRKLFHRDILQRIQMAALSGKDIWKGAPPPTPLLPPEQAVELPQASEGWNDQKVMSIEENIALFLSSAKKLFERFQGGSHPIDWDKDDDDALDFVVSASNIRSHMFNIPIQSRFDIKAMAGNIIPAIATTNAIIAGLIVLEAMKVLDNQMDRCKYTYLLRRPSGNQVLMDVELEAPNPDCYICSSSQVRVALDTSQFTLQQFADDILKKELGMAYPSLFLGSDNLYECSPDMDEEDEEHMKEQGVKTLLSVGLGDGILVRAEDEFQDLSLDVILIHREQAVSDDETEAPRFEIVKEDAPAPSGNEDEATESKEDAPPTVASGKRARPEDDLPPSTEEPPSKQAKH